VLAVLAVLALPGTSMADPIRDCNFDGDLDRIYPNSELRSALDRIPTDLDEYSNCREIISGAIAGGSDRGGNRPTAGTEGGAPLTPEEQVARTKDGGELEAITRVPGEKAVEEGTAPKAAKPPRVEVGGEIVQPGSDGLFELASASNDVPTPLLVALVALALLAVIGGLVALRQRLPLLDRVPLLSKIPAIRVPFPRIRR